MGNASWRGYVTYQNFRQHSKYQTAQTNTLRRPAVLRCRSLADAVASEKTRQHDRRADRPAAGGAGTADAGRLPRLCRDTLARKCDGLTGDQLRERAVPPSSMSLLGLVRQMAEGEHQ